MEEEKDLLIPEKEKLELIKAKKKDVQGRISEMIKKDPSKGPMEFATELLKEHGYNPKKGDFAEMHNFIRKNSKLRNNKAQRKMLLNTIREYNREYCQAVENMTNDTYNVSGLLKSFLGTLTKGAAKGAGVAATVNTILPGLVPTLAGYFTGTAKASLFTKVLILTGSAAAAPEISGAAVVAAGAAIGSVTALGVKAIAKGIKNIKDKKIEDEER